MAMVSSSACFGRLAPRVFPGDVVGDDEVLVVGRARFEPPVSTSSDAPDSLFVGVGWEPAAASPGLFGDPIHLGSQAGVLFAQRLPRKDFVIRSVMMKTGSSSSMSGMTGLTTTMYYTVCRFEVPIEVSSTDEAVYVGLLTCYHERGKPVRAKVEDEWDIVAPLAKDLLGGRKIVLRVDPASYGPSP